MKADTIEITIPSKHEYLNVVRLTVSGIANRMGFSYDEIEDIKIALTEACTNSVNHAYLDREGKIQINFLIFTDRLEVIVADEGEKFNVQVAFEKNHRIDAKTPVENLSEGGLGLLLIDTLMDKVEIKEDAGITVSMTKFLSQNGVRGDVNQAE